MLTETIICICIDATHIGFQDSVNNLRLALESDAFILCMHIAPSTLKPINAYSFNFHLTFPFTVRGVFSKIMK
jgi:hypothetical protein